MLNNENFIHTKHGYCYYWIEKDRIPLIYNLYVEPIYRHQGHARELLSWVIEMIRKTGYTDQIQIEASPNDISVDVKRLICFYETMGLKIFNKKE